jgi:hypothetical protein
VERSHGVQSISDLALAHQSKQHSRQKKIEQNQRPSKFARDGVSYVTDAFFLKSDKSREIMDLRCLLKPTQHILVNGDLHPEPQRYDGRIHLHGELYRKY